MARITERPGYKAMWSLAFYDLPVKTKDMKRAHSRWRKYLLSEGFVRLQLSVYGKHFPSQASSRACLRRLQTRLPCFGQVRLLTVTERQMEKMDVFMGEEKTAPESVPEQILLL